MADIPRGTDKSGEQPAPATVGAPLELHPQTPEAKHEAAKALAKSDDKMVKANVLPPLPDFPAAETPANASMTTNTDAQHRSDRVMTGKGQDGVTFIQQVTQFDSSGVATSKESMWTDSKGKKHDVTEQNGVTTNTIKDAISTEKLITRADGSWEHDSIIRGKETITKVGKDHSVSLTDKNLSKGVSHETVTHANGFTEDNVIDTKHGYKDLKTKDSTGLLRFENIVAAHTDDGRSEYHSNKRYDHTGGVMSDDSHWKDKDGVYHEDDLINFADRSSIHEVTTGDTTVSTSAKPGSKPKSVIVKADGTNIDPTTGQKRRPDALDEPDR